MARVNSDNYQSYMKGTNRQIDTHTREMYLSSSPTVQAGYGPYDSTETAHKVACYMFDLNGTATASTPCAKIQKGFTVAIENPDGSITEYQYKKQMPAGGYTSSDLEVKAVSSVTANDVPYNSSTSYDNDTIGKAIKDAAKDAIDALSDTATNAGDIGTISHLKTVYKNDLVGAINEVKDAIPTSMSAENVTYNPSGNHTVGSIAKAVATAEGNIQNLDNVIGTGGSINSRISGAVAVETTRAQAAEADRYTKSETYTKEEVHNLITTPNQEYVSVTATALTTAITDVLPVTGAADTIYRVGNWDGTQYNDSVFSEYAWNGNAYIKLSTKSQIGEVYDISANHANTKYANLTAALGTNGDNVPSTIRKGGMSVKFINSTTNKYEQWNLKASSWSTNTSDWALDVDGSVTNGKLKLPFELEKPSDSEYVTQASQIGYKGKSLDDSLDDIESSVNVSSKREAYYIVDSLGNILGQFDAQGLKVTDVKVKMSGVLTSLVTLIASLQSSVNSKVDKVSGKGLTSNDYTNEEKEKLASIKTLESVDESEFENIFYLVDKFNNIIFKIDAAGVHSVGYHSNKFDIIDSGSAFYITDSSGYIAFKIDNEGAHGVGIGQSNGQFPTLYSNTLYGKRIYSLCDSLGEGDWAATKIKWQQVVADRCGATFVYGQSRELVSGGTTTLSDSDWNCGQKRALNLYNNYGPEEVDVIFIENINDSSFVSLGGSISDTPYMLKNMITPETIYESKAEAISAFMTKVGTITPEVGAMLRLKYRSNGYKIIVSGSLAQSGTISVGFSDGNIVSTTTISSLNDAVNALKSANWVQYGFTVSSSGSNYIIITDTQDRGVSVPTITSLTTDTGLTLQQQEADTTSYYSKCFVSYDVADWNDASNWKMCKEITLYSIYKGLLEYLQTNFPKAQIYFIAFPRLAYNYASGTNYKRADGSRNWDTFRGSTTQGLIAIQKEVCEYMNVECIDLSHRCGVNIYNMQEYYPSNNVHPTATGYTYFGEQIARIIC